jgi:hypothetical protein
VDVPRAIDNFEVPATGADNTDQTGLIVGAVVGAVILWLLLCCKRRKRREAPAPVYASQTMESRMDTFKHPAKRPPQVYTVNAPAYGSKAFNAAAHEPESVYLAGDVGVPTSFADMVVAQADDSMAGSDYPPPLLSSDAGAAGLLARRPFPGDPSEEEDADGIGEETNDVDGTRLTSKRGAGAGRPFNRMSLVEFEGVEAVETDVYAPADFVFGDRDSQKSSSSSLRELMTSLEDGAEASLYPTRSWRVFRKYTEKPVPLHRPMQTVRRRPGAPAATPAATPAAPAPPVPQPMNSGAWPARGAGHNTVRLEESQRDRRRGSLS